MEQIIKSTYFFLYIANELFIERVKGSSFECGPDHDSDIDLGSEDEVDHLRIAINVNEAEQIVYE